MKRVKSERLVDLDSFCALSKDIYGWGGAWTGPAPRTLDFQVDCLSADGFSMMRGYLPAIELAGIPKLVCHRRKIGIYRGSRPCERTLQGGATVAVQADDIVVQATDQPCSWRMPANYRYSSIVMEEEYFRECMPGCVSLVNGRPLRLGLTGRALDHLMTAAWDDIGASRIEGVSTQFMRAFGEVLALTLQLRTGRPADEAAALSHRRADVMAYIDRYFASPALSIADVASQLGTSTRSIQLAFAASGRCPSEYLRDRRLSEAAKCIRDPSWGSRTITDILHACGFSNASHFSAQFKQKYGVSPRGYRNESAIGGASA